MKTLHTAETALKAARRAINVSLICAQVLMRLLLAEPVRKDAKAVESYSHNSFISFNSRRLSCRNISEGIVVVSLCKSSRAKHKRLINLFIFALSADCTCSPDVRFAPRLSSLHLSAYNFFQAFTARR